MKRAILLVSFGTSHEDTRKKTLDVMLEQMRENFPEYPVYQAWTSGRILHKLESRDGIHIDTVEQAMQRMILEGVQELLVQPTHMIGGIENDRMKADVQKYEHKFARVVFGDPLLTTEEDSMRVFHGAMSHFTLAEDEAMIWMGHGTEHYANRVYSALQKLMDEYAQRNVFMATVEAAPTIEDVVEKIQKTEARKIIIAPFMVVAGEHAKNDMSGDGENSWKNICLRAGFSVKCVIRGLGEYPEVREVMLDHAEKTMGYFIN